MKILIINQHSKNHGDEAAGLALLRGLYNHGYTDIQISYNMDFPWNEQCKIKYKDIKHLNPIKFNKNSYRAINYFNKYPGLITKLACLIFSDLRKEYFSIKHSDVIINAPGGVNLGLYNDPRYMWRLIIAKLLNKKYIIYSPSIGPFDKSNMKYIHRAKEILYGASFLSLRDKKSYDYAEQLQVPYIKSIDTAFLETPKESLLPEALYPILDGKYIVIVPNQLYNWHPSFMGSIKPTILDDFYVKLISTFNKMGHKVILLPQLYEQGEKNDEYYFDELKGKLENVFVISSLYSSDIQQIIINKAEFIIGARYHSIVFAINNNTPFCCISYEHKMTDMLEILDLKEYSIDIKNILKNIDTCFSRILEIYENKEVFQDKLSEAKSLAKEMACNCFEKFILKLQDN